MTAICQSCEVAQATVTDKCDDPVEPYLLCGSCHARLKARSLRPLEWYNLAKRHGWYQYFLHDDFYDDDGTAWQPEADVIEAERFPIPDFASVCSNPETLLDWSITRWHLRDQEFLAWSIFSPDTKLRVLSNRFSATANSGIRSLILEIIGKTGDASNVAFVRYAWREYPENISLGSLVHASATCLPFEEGFERAISALASLEPSQRRNSMYCLGYFGSPAGLDWIEKNCSQPITESWGYLAAMCRPSWARLTAWLSRGRPLSLVAIDTLEAIARLRTPLLKERRVRLEQAPSFTELEAVLREYECRDPVPRVQKKVSGLLGNFERITNT